MKLSLLVLTPGKFHGKIISIMRSPFVIGRDPQCHLRPASVVVSKRHCALSMADGKVFLQDFDSTNGTFLNHRQVNGQIELHNGDHISLGFLEFAVQLETTVPLNKPTPLPGAKYPADTAVDELAAILLLSGPEGMSASGTHATDTHDGSDTDVQPGYVPGTFPDETSGQPADKHASVAGPEEEADTATAAKAILEHYLRTRRHKNKTAPARSP